MLDITGFGIDLPAYALSRVQAAAMSIENRMYAGMAGCRILRLHHDPRMLGTPAEGIVAISRDDVIVAANRAARQMLGRPGGTPAPRALDEVFAGGLRAAAAGATGAATLNGRGASAISSRWSLRRLNTGAGRDAGRGRATAIHAGGRRRSARLRAGRRRAGAAVRQRRPRSCASRCR